MRKPGSEPSRRKPSADPRAAVVVAALLAATGFTAIADEGSLRPYAVVGDSIPASLTGAVGDPARGRAIVLDRRLGACLLCHTGPFPEERFQGTLAPDLSGTGSRWSAGQLRLRLVDATRLNPDTIMPPYYRIDGLTRVGAAWRGKPILTAEQIEDVVAFLLTLHN
jgi:L-cysteine S-thiosulfotransferase